MKISASYTRRDLQNARSMLKMAEKKKVSVSQLLLFIEEALDPPISIRPAGMKEELCPSCGRFVMVPPRGVTEPVLVCPSCRYSEYRG